MKRKKASLKESTSSSNNRKGSELKQGLKLYLDESTKATASLPILGEIYDNFSRKLAHSLKDYLDENLSINITNHSQIVFGKHLQSLKNFSMLGIFKLTKYPNRQGIIIFNSDLIYDLIEILFGGKKISTKLKVVDRPFTDIEYGVLQNVIQIIINDLNDEFKKVANIQFEFDRIENDTGSALIVSENELSNLLEMELKIKNKDSGKMSIIIPNATLSPFKQEFLKPISSKNLSADPKWFSHFEEVVNNSVVKLRAEYNETIWKIQDLKNLQVGSTIVLNKLEHENWDVTINSNKVADCKPGQINDRLAVELIDDINASKYTK